jgi:hypothetical protein
MAALDLVQHLLRRTGFSGSPDQIAVYAAMEYDAAVDDSHAVLTQHRHQ